MTAKRKVKARKVWVLRGNPDGGRFWDGDFCEAFATKKEAVAAAKAMGHSVGRRRSILAPPPSMGVIQLPDAGGTIMLSPAARKAFPDCEEWIKEIGEVCAELDPDIDLGGLWVHVVKRNARNRDDATGVATASKLSGNGRTVARYHEAGKVEVRVNDAPDMAEFIEVVAHEMRHIGQYKRGESFNTRALDGGDYFGHPSEVAARKFSVKVCKKFGVKACASTTVAKLSSGSRKYLADVGRRLGHRLIDVECLAHQNPSVRERLDELAECYTPANWDDMDEWYYVELIQHILDLNERQWPSFMVFPKSLKSSLA
jgi:hypothetical protein